MKQSNGLKLLGSNFWVDNTQIKIMVSQVVTNIKRLKLRLYEKILEQ